MPELTSDDLKRLVREGLIGGITIDTTVFDRLGGNLEAASLLAFSQFGGTPVSFLLTDVVANEIRAHLRRNATDGTARLRSALRDYHRHREARRNAIAEAGQLLGIDHDIDEEVLGAWQRFIAATYPVPVSAGQYLDSDKLLAAYFAFDPPFEDRKDKRHEFPDAIALFELEAWAAEAQCVVLAVSHDTGWADYARRSRRIAVVDDLATALALFHNDDSFLAERAAALLMDASSALSENVEQALRDYVAALSPYIGYHAAYPAEAEYLDGSYVDREDIPPDHIRIIASSGGIVTLSFTVLVDVAAEASFGFFHPETGSLYSSVGSAVVEQTARIAMPVIVEIRRQMEPDQAPESVRVDAAFDVELDFGDVGPELDRFH